MVMTLLLNLKLAQHFTLASRDDLVKPRTAIRAVAPSRYAQLIDVGKVVKPGHRAVQTVGAVERERFQIWRSDTPHVQFGQLQTEVSKVRQPHRRWLAVDL